jgi:hypothetical protein
LAKIYGNDIQVYGKEILESYDRGYLICGSILKNGEVNLIYLPNGIYLFQLIEYGKESGIQKIIKN